MSEKRRDKCTNEDTVWHGESGKTVSDEGAVEANGF